MGWYAVDERSPDTHRGEREAEASERAKELAEAGAAYAGAPEGPRVNPAAHGDATDSTEPRQREVNPRAEDAEPRKDRS